MVTDSTIALVAACMARNCTPEETDQVMAKLYGTMPPEKASDIQRQLESAIDEVQADAPSLVDMLFGDSTKKQKEDGR